MVPPNSRGISRVPRYLGSQLQSSSQLRLPGYYRLWHAFPERFGSPLSDLAGSVVPHAVSRDPSHTMPTGHRCTRFGLIPVRSPLLRESRLISFPRATKMLQFARLPLAALYIQAEVTPHDRRGVAPFGYLRVQGSLHLAGAVSLLATPFIGSQRQGIHRAPLVTYFPTMQIGEYRRNHFADVGTAGLRPQTSDPRLTSRAQATTEGTSSVTSRGRYAVVKVHFPDRPTRRSGLKAETRNVHVTRSVPAPNLVPSGDGLDARPTRSVVGGDDRARTGDLLRARETLSQLSYVPTLLRSSDPTRAVGPYPLRRKPGHPYAPPTEWWAHLDLNQGPRPYQGRALAN